jgi:hypothetical protein
MKVLTKLCIPFFLLAFAFTSCLDEDFDQPPTTGNVPDLEVTTTISELKAMHAMGSLTNIDEDLVIKGTVVADDFTGNWYRSMVIQDETSGITVLIDQVEAYFIYPVGREVFIKLKGLTMSDYNNLIQLGVYNPATKEVEEISTLADHVFKSVKREVPAPKVVKPGEFQLEDVSTLVKLENVVFSQSGVTFADAAGQNSINLTLEDCEGRTATVRTSGFASFAGELVPEGRGSLTGILSIYNFNALQQSDFQILIRSLDDLEMDGNRSCPAANFLQEDFESGSNNMDVALSGWTNVAVRGTRRWQFKLFDNNLYCQATAYNDSSPEMEAWLITPLVNLDKPKTLSFETAKAFWTHDALSVWISTDFTGNQASATWQLLNATLPGQNSADHAFISSGNIDLSPLTGQTVAIAFKYVGKNSAGQTSSYRIDNVVVKDL